VARWLTTAIIVIYHVRFFLFAQYQDLNDKGLVVSAFYFITSLGHEAFVVYMALSGIMLGGLSYKRWKQKSDPWLDLRRKSVWFYALLVPALLIGGLLDLIGSGTLAASGVYAYFSHFAPGNLSLESLIGNLLVLQRFVVPGLGSNSMLYLLSYECWAYMIFAALFLYLKQRRGGAAVIACALTILGTILAPEFFGYLVVWMIGLRTSRIVEQGGARIGLGVGVAIFLITLMMARVGGAYLTKLPDVLVPWARMLLDILFALGFALFALSFNRKPRAPAVHSWSRTLFARLNSRFAGVSTALIATHFPFLMIIVAGGNLLLSVPIGGQPHPSIFLFFIFTTVALYVYSFFFSGLTMHIVRFLRRVKRSFMLQR